METLARQEWHNAYSLGAWFDEALRALPAEAVRVIAGTAAFALEQQLPAAEKAMLEELEIAAEERKEINNATG